MAEHDEIVRQAAETAASNCVAKPSGTLIHDVETALAPFFAAARKEAREGAFLEAGNACIGASLDGTRANDERPGLRAAAGVIAALRSKPKEPAIEHCERCGRPLGNRGLCPTCDRITEEAAR